MTTDNINAPHLPATDKPSVVPVDWPSDTPPEADVPPPTQRGPSGDETDRAGETDEANA